MAVYYTSRAYDAPADRIWPILTDFASWPRWFPNVSAVYFENGAHAGQGAELVAIGDRPDVWTRWQISEWSAPSLLICRHVDSNSPMAPMVTAAYLRFELADDAEGCTLEVEGGAEGAGFVGGFFLDMTLAPEVRRLLPQLIDAFSDHVVTRTSEPE